MAKINAPLHIIPFLLFKVKSLRSIKKAVKAVITALINMLRSIMFMTFYIAIFRTVGQMYGIRTPFRISNWAHNLLISAVTPAGIAWEQPHRRLDLVYFTMPRAIETYWNMLRNR
jgi:hypothetical protein